MGEHILRGYQRTAIAAVESSWLRCWRQLLVMATGTGKTHVFAEIARREIAQSGRVLIMAHRSELLDHSTNKVEALGIETAREHGRKHAFDSDAPVVIASVDSIARRLDKWRRDAFELIIIDEAHHSTAAKYLRILEHFEGARVLGVTATPDRSDRKSLSSVFDSIAFEYGLREAIRDGWLCPIRAALVPIQIDMHGVKTRAGDYSAESVGSAIDPMLENVAEAIVERFEDRRSMVFLPLVEISKRFASMLCDRGLSAAHVDGASKDRAKSVEAFKRGDVQILCNSLLFTEGFDVPEVSCIVNLRATKSRALYQQIIGRGTRIAEGKDDLLILDFLWHTGKHDLCRPASLFARDKAEAERMLTEIHKDAGEGVDLLEVKAAAHKSHEEALAKRLERSRGRRARTVDPLEFGILIHDIEIAEYEPTMYWEGQAVSERQRAILDRNGIDHRAVKCRGHASAIIDRIMARREAGLCTVKQSKVLYANGIDPSGVTFDEAKRLIDEIFGRVA